MSALGCGGQVTERDQWTVWIATDTPVPALVDRALVEILSEDGELACSDCRRQLGLPTSPAQWPISFGVAAPATGPRPRVRVRLYRASRAGADGLPFVGTTLDRLARLPPARGNTEVAMVLFGECLGVAASVTDGTSCVGTGRELLPEAELASGPPPAAVRPGTWARAAIRPCDVAPPDDLVCVPGGLLALGDSSAVAGQWSSAPERFARLDPFYLDRDEVTVGVVRELVRAGRIPAPPELRAADSRAVAAECTFLGPDDAANDELPINCVSHPTAAAVCAARGMRLPTEAEWEWTAGNLGAETRYPWGDDGDPCEHAHVGLGRTTTEAPQAIESKLCRVRPGLPARQAGLPRTRHERDVTALGVRGLAGGVAEWLADVGASYDAPCWAPEEPFLDRPRCDRGGALRALRGGSWLSPPSSSVSVRRRGDRPSLVSPGVGFRCAMDAEVR